MKNIIFNFDTDLEIAYHKYKRNLQVGMYGEWWSGKVDLGMNFIRHKKETVDDGYRPAKVIMSEKDGGYVFEISGGFYEGTVTVEITREQLRKSYREYITMRRYNIPVKFVFAGTFTVEADTREEAERKVDENCGLCLGGTIHTNDDTVVDWDFGIHPELIIRRDTNGSD